MSTKDKGTTSRGQAKRDQVRLAAQELFLERGFAGASTDAIAKEAGVSKETLYNHFPSKEDLLADVLGHLISDVSKNRLPALGGALTVNSREALREAFVDLAHGLVSNLMQPDYLALVRVIITETPRLPQLGDLFRSTVAEQALGNVAALLDKAQLANVVPAVDKNAAARMFVGPLLTYVLLDGLLKGEGPPRKPTEQQVEAIVNLYLEAILKD